MPEKIIQRCSICPERENHLFRRLKFKGDREVVDKDVFVCDRHYQRALHLFQVIAGYTPPIEPAPGPISLRNL